MDTVKVKAVLSNITKGGVPVYQLVIKDSKPLPQDDFVKKFAEAINKTPAEARYISDVHGQIFCQGIVQNKIVNTGNLRGYLTIEGSLDSVGAAIDPVKNPLKAIILAHGDFKDAVKSVVAVNDTQVVEAVLYTVQYDTSDLLNTIEGTGPVKINGQGLKITEANTDEGVWLETLEGVVVGNKATISTNTANALNVAFATLPSTTTTNKYRLVIATRNGESKDDYGVVRLERIVTIIPPAA